MLRPAQIPVSQYPLVTKALLGYEDQLYVSTQQYTNLGSALLVAANSGVYTANTSDNATLLGAPQELLAILDTDLADTAPVTVTLTGTDSTGAALTGTATFQAPGYAQDTSNSFPPRWAAEVIPTVDGKLWKTITGMVFVNTVAAVNTVIRIVGVPSLSSYVKIGQKVSLNFDPKVPMPTAIQDGRDMGAQIKGGIIDVGTLEISAKIPAGSDGLARYNGRRVTGLVKEIKEDKVPTQNIFLCGLIMTSKAKVGEGAEPATWDATAMYEKIGMVLASGTPT